MSYQVEAVRLDGVCEVRGPFVSHAAADAYRHTWHVADCLRCSEVVPCSGTTNEPEGEEAATGPVLVSPSIWHDPDSGRILALFNGKDYELECRAFSWDFIKEDGQVYTVTDGGCTCPDRMFRYQEKTACKHMMFRERFKDKVAEILHAELSEGGSGHPGGGAAADRPVPPGPGGG